MSTERHHEPTSTTHMSFAPLATQKCFPPTMPTQPLTTSSKDYPMQINKIRFKPFIEQEK
jgi:hypothetical protein